MQGCLLLCTGHSHEGTLDVVSLVLVLVARLIISKIRERVHPIQAGDNACQAMTGYLLQIITPLRGRGDTMIYTWCALLCIGWSVHPVRGAEELYDPPCCLAIRCLQLPFVGPWENGVPLMTS